jgi:predicted metalloendopeptidase
MSEELLRVLVLSNPHAPPHFRVNGPLSNLPAFAEAFAIRPGSSPMARAPEDRVRIW